MSEAIGCEKLIMRAGNPRRRDRHEYWMAVPLLLFGVASTAGHAGPAGSTPIAIHLRYHRDDLGSPAAARRLFMRIGEAALEACGASTFSLPDYQIATRSSRCWRDAVDDATRRIGDPTLSALAVAGHDG